MCKVVLAVLCLAACLAAAPVPLAPPTRSDPHQKAYYGFAGLMSEGDGTRPTVFQNLPDSPVEKVGIRQGDLLVSIAGQPIKTLTDVCRAESQCPYRPGAVVEVVVERDGKFMTFKVTLGALSPSSSAPPPEKPRG